MMRMLATIALLALPGAAWAAETPGAGEPRDWAVTMNGIDGVIVYCDVTSKQAYAKRICEELGAAIEAGFAGTALPVRRTGAILSGAAAKGKDPTDPESVRTAEGIARPLLMRIRIKGTDDGNPAIYIGLSAAVPMTAAAEAGSDEDGKAGDLVVAEEDVVANGPKKRLPGVLIDHMTVKARTMIDAIRTGL